MAPQANRGKVNGTSVFVVTAACRDKGTAMALTTTQPSARQRREGMAAAPSTPRPAARAEVGPVAQGVSQWPSAMLWAKTA